MFLLAHGLRAQTGSGSIQGTVTDVSGAVLPDAAVRLIHIETGREFTTQTSGSGVYLFPSTQIGPYRMAVESPGMAPWEGRLTLLAGQRAVVDITMQLAGAAAAVTVSSDVSPLLTTNSPTLATVVERARIEQLPLNGRLITSLVYMTTPGVEQDTNSRIFGLRYASEFLQDGAALTNREFQSLPDRPPGLDTVAELRVETNNSSAKMNRPGSIMVSTRSGTNQWHGSAFETARNSGLGVARARTDFYQKPPHLVRNEFGASLGGPIMVPKVYRGRDRTFFFFAWEGIRQRAASTRSTAVPTAAMRQGDFLGLVDNQNRRFTLYDPLSTASAPGTWTRTPFLNNAMPVSRMSPLAKYLYSVTPLPTTADNPLVAPNWYGLGFDHVNGSTLTTRIDHRLSDRDQVFFRYSHGVNSAANTRDPFGNAPTTLDGKANAQLIEGQVDSGVVSWTHTFSPVFFSETLVTVTRDYHGILPNTGGEDVATPLGLPNPFRGAGFPRIPQNGGFMTYDSSVNPAINYSWIVNIDENLTRVRGRHEFQFGGRLRLERLTNLEGQQIAQGQVNFNSLATSLYDRTSGANYGAVPFTGHASANLFLGMGSYTARFNRSWLRVRAGENTAYFQDNFRVNSRLTLNLGVRYEYNTPVREVNSTILGFDQASKRVLLPRSVEELSNFGVALPAIVKAYDALGVKYSTPGDVGLPSALVYPNRLDFGPRAGFAYRFGASGRAMVLRGGYSLFAYPESLRLFQASVKNTIPSLGTVSNNPNAAAESPDGLPNYLLRSVPAIVAGANSASALSLDRIGALTRGSGGMYFLNPRQPTARANMWSLTFEREILANTVFKAGWAGTHGTRMAQWYSFNEAPPDYVWYRTTGLPLPTGAYAAVARRPYDQEVYGTMQRYQKTGWSNNNSFTLEVERRYARGMAFQIFYVLSNSFRTAGDGFRDDILPSADYFLPGTVPAGDAARNRLLFYRRDSDIPKHRVNGNFIVDLPFGKGKPVARGAGRLLDTFIGGWQLAGNGSLRSRYFQLPDNMAGPVGAVEVYGKKHPIKDCRSGVCYNGWLFWNGYIPPNRINSYDARGNPNGVMGVPDSYRPFQTFLVPRPKDGGSASDPLFPFYDTNTVFVPLKNGTLQRTSYDPGLAVMQNQYVLGPMQWSMAASLFKTVRLGEKLQLRINVDFLNNVFNMPGLTLPAADGVLTTRLSANTPRVLQLTARLKF
jgi:hypothetical protein